MNPELIARHRAFWEPSEPALPLCEYFTGGLFPLATFKHGLRDGLLGPEMILPEAWEPFYRDVGFGVPKRHELVEVAYPFVNIPWMEGIMGCPIRVTLSSYSIGSEPFLGSLKDLDAVEKAALDPDNPWLLKLLDFQRFLVRSFGQERPVGVPVLRGPIDLACAMLGGANAVFAMSDFPEEMERLLRICADAWLHTAKALIAIVPPFEGGYFNYRLIWMPEPAPVMQEDNASLLSPALYRRFVLPEDERILAQFAYPIFHTHTGGMHVMLNDLIASPFVKALDSCWDPPPFGPPVEKLIPAYQRIQDAGKSLYIVAVGVPSERDLLLLQRELSPRGLCVFFEAQDDAAAERIATQMENGWKQNLPRCTG
jgi:hypothetical protein